MASIPVDETLFIKSISNLPMSQSSPSSPPPPRPPSKHIVTLLAVRCSLSLLAFRFLLLAARFSPSFTMGFTDVINRFFSTSPSPNQSPSQSHWFNRRRRHPRRRHHHPNPNHHTDEPLSSSLPSTSSSRLKRTLDHLRSFCSRRKGVKLLTH